MYTGYFAGWAEARTYMDGRPPRGGGHQLDKRRGESGHESGDEVWEGRRGTVEGPDGHVTFSKKKRLSQIFCMGSDKKAAHIVWESDRARTTYIVNRVPLRAF